LSAFGIGSYFRTRDHKHDIAIAIFESAGAAEKSCKDGTDAKTSVIIAAMEERMKLRQHNNPELFELIRSLTSSLLIPLLINTWATLHLNVRKWSMKVLLK